ncbi:MAG: 50S ribosome-binding GTPase [Candidatus Bathyarchaeota archaeon]|nr:50S ribosome-binding GTPase [Candidatus Termiticorpusculum sp.]MCL1971141.1 50S ribosome-binding GTPase [Candidatus Termiticorpusculum sp.]
MTYTVALIGNPNVGKSVIFNNLVPGAHQHVGNWPGKTVEKKEGKFTHKGKQIKLVDLPGTYSLTAAAEDELISRNFIVDEKPNLVVDIVDASNLERNLYLTYLLLELETNILLVLNMTDIAEDKGYKIDVNKLSFQLGIPIISTVATKGTGLKELKDAILTAANSSPQVNSKVYYGEKIEKLINNIIVLLKKDHELSQKYSLRWLAIKLLEKDEQILDIIKKSKNATELLEIIS